jgi:hypothetical protein
VAQLVGHHTLHFGRWRLLQQGVEHDDAPCRADPAHIGVERGRPAGGVGHEDVLDRDAVAGRHFHE